ncbi:MAG: 1-(5-phosphoribosyl)-5-[(5-phosphoribosylamino)methylideneamino]imidazole-4-carboxamide isomerase [Candidatus Omnitrophota bacterium]|nr:1-(5-phosphoribosyl)-5-[(5-phosphoribosylamino)methylideneamino]imidazole-4-carboxamide isomerase [Candidatus Omnitrophota bacterium]
MIVIPAIDIIQGRVVRLHQGDFSKETFYSDDPVEMALTWQEKGAKLIHIVDLDGARCGKVKNREIIAKILKKLNVRCEIGGGLRQEKEIEDYLSQGAKRLVVGTKAIEDIDNLKKLVGKFQEKLIVSIDFAGGKVVKKGWQEGTDVSPLGLAKKIQEIGVKTIVLTDISTDGTLTGPNMEMLNKILSSVNISVIASGGISKLSDIEKLKQIKNKNLEGVIIGRALYEGKFDLEEAIKIVG